MPDMPGADPNSEFRVVKYDFGELDEVARGGPLVRQVRFHQGPRSDSIRSSR